MYNENILAGFCIAIEKKAIFLIADYLNA